VAGERRAGEGLLGLVRLLGDHSEDDVLLRVREQSEADPVQASDLTRREDAEAAEGHKRRDDLDPVRVIPLGVRVSMHARVRACSRRWERRWQPAANRTDHAANGAVRNGAVVGP